MQKTLDTVDSTSSYPVKNSRSGVESLQAIGHGDREGRYYYTLLRIRCPCIVVATLAVAMPQDALGACLPDTVIVYLLFYSYLQEKTKHDILLYTLNHILR